MAGEVVQQCRINLKKLKDISSSGTKGLADPELRQLRETVRETCLKALQLEYENAQRDDVERKLWRFVFYLPIAEFRSRLTSPSITDQLKSKTLAAYLKFLDDAVSYYETLISHLSAALDAATSNATASSVVSTRGVNKEDTAAAAAAVATKTTLQSSLRTSLARCYICIGDLKRYSVAATISNSKNDPTTTTTEAAAVNANANDETGKEKGNDTGPSAAAPSSSLYSSARHAYAAAVGIDPTFGNAYNQLAVIDELEGDALAAAFFYLRAQCALTPFPLGHQNAALLFGAAVTAENTAQAAATTAAAAAAGVSSKKKARKDYFSNKNKNTPAQQQQQQQQQQRGSMPTPVLEKEIISKYLALSGCLYEKIDVDATPLRLSTVGAFLDEFLNRLKQQTGSGGVAKCARRVAQEFHAMPTTVEAAVEQRPVSLLFLITAVPLLLLQIHEDSLRAISTASTTNLTASAAARGYTTSYLLDITSRLLTAASKLRLTTKGPVGDAALSCPVFTAISVVLRWLVMRKAQPALIVDSLAHVESTVSGLQDRRIGFWKACTALTQVLPLTGITNVEVSEEERKNALLSEDYLLTGFTPLLRCFIYNKEEGKQQKETEVMKEKDEDPIASRALKDALTSTPSSFSSRSTAKYQWNESDPGKPGSHRARRIWEDLQTLASHARPWISTTSGGGDGDDGGEVKELKHAVNEFIEAIDIWPRPVAETNNNNTNITITTEQEPPAVEHNKEKEDAAEEAEEEEEEEIVFAPLSAARRSNSAAALFNATSAGNSGRSTPALPIATNQNNVTTMDVDNMNTAGDGGGGGGHIAPAAAAMVIDNDDEMREEDPQEAMERTGYAMAATVLSSDDAEILVHGQGQRGEGSQLPLQPPPAPPVPSSSLLGGSFLFNAVAGGGGGTTAGYYTHGDTNAGSSLLMSSWQQQQQQPLYQQQQQPDGGAAAAFGVPPPFPSSGLISGAMAHQQQQEPAEGLRAVLFGGNMQQQQQQQQQQPHGGGGNLWR